MIDPTALRTLCEQATPGPLSVVNDNEGMPMEYGPLWKVVSPDPSPDDEPYFEAIVHYGVKADADLIAAAREALPQLLDENAALRAQREASDQRAVAAQDALGLERLEHQRTKDRLAALTAAGREYLRAVKTEQYGIGRTVDYKTAKDALSKLLRSDP